jgi:CubicO group peptidase (beta-lactamase class C family)
MIANMDAGARWQVVEALLARAVGSVFPAAQLLVADRLQVVFTRSVGAASDSTIFDLASLTKALATTTLTMRFEERGLLSLAEEVCPGITVRLLLCHASGLPAWRPLALRPGIPERRAGMVAAARMEPLESAPGAVSRYSDLGFILLGDFLERRGGAQLDTLFSREVARPLGSGLTFHPERARCAPTSDELVGVVHDANARAMEGVAGHAGLFGTAEDVYTLARSLLGSYLARADLPTCIGAETVRRYFTPCGIPGSTWCLGWDRPSQTGSSVGERWPRSGVGHLGFTGCSLWLDPPRGRAVILLSNRVYPTPANDEIKRFRPILHDAIVAALED